MWEVVDLASKMYQQCWNTLLSEADLLDQKKECKKLMSDS